MTSTETTTGQDFEAAVAQATYYVQSRFFPPLPAAYGRLAVEAVDGVNIHGASHVLVLPEGLNPLPRHAFEVDGDVVVRAGDLVEALRLEHMLASDEDEDFTLACPSCDFTTESLLDLEIHEAECG